MKVLVYLSSVAACFGLFFLMMKVKADVSVMVQERKSLSYQQAQLQEDVRVLNAEYAMFSGLTRLTKLATARGFVEAKMSQLK